MIYWDRIPEGRSMAGTAGLGEGHARLGLFETLLIALALWVSSIGINEDPVEARTTKYALRTY